jgi:glycine betaine/choline ABC-type transport system substrate-binding protein
MAETVSSSRRGGSGDVEIASGNADTGLLFDTDASIRAGELARPLTFLSDDQSQFPKL